MKRTLESLGICVLLIALSTWVLGDVRFGAAQSFGIGINGQQAVSTDLNEDGHLDIAVVDRHAGFLVLMFGDGNAGFTIASPFPCGDEPRSIRSGDLNEDSHMDLVVGHGGSQDGVTVLLGDGSGGLPSLVHYPLSGEVNSLAIDDFNEDGHLDVVGAPEESRTVALLLGDGSGALGPPAYFDCGLTTFGVVARDYNEDGHLDVVVSHRYDTDVTMLLGDGLGSFGPPTRIPVGSTPRRMVAADFDEDGHLDLAITTAGVTMMFGDGSGGFGPPVQIPLIVYQGSHNITTGDFNEDGHADLAVRTFPNDNLMVLLGDGAGGFDPPLPFAIGNLLIDILNGDFDEDGHLDLVTLVHYKQEVALLLGIGNGDFEGIRRAATVRDPAAVLARDFDEDGDLDLVTADSTHRVRLFPGEGNGEFGPFHYERMVGADPRFLCAGDWNGDGLLDVASYNRGSDDISLLRNNGAGHFHPAYTFWAGRGIGPFDGADMNEDGILDLIVPSQDDTAVSILEGLGAGGFNLPNPFATSAGPEYVLCGDFNEDDDMDVAVATSHLTIHLGDGEGSLGPPQDFPAGNDPASLASFDLDDDGHLDLVVGNRDGDVRVFLGDGAGAFSWIQTLESIHSSVYSAPAIACGDLDGDGVPDLAIAVDLPGSVLFFRGLGTGEFVLDQMTRNYTPPDWYHPAIALGDLHEDGQPDVVIGSPVREQILVILNHSLGVPDVHRCLRGTVNSGVEPVADVLLVNGSAGDEERIVEVGEGTAIQGSMLQPPEGGSGDFVVHANFGTPGPKSVVELPALVGANCFPFLLSHGAEPDAVWNCLGKEAAVGASTYFDGSSIPDPAPAPTTFLDLPGGDPTYLPAGTIVTLQGVIRDPGSTSPRGGSVTNAVVLRIL